LPACKRRSQHESELLFTGGSCSSRQQASSIEFPQDDAVSSEQLDMKKLRDEKGLKLPKDRLRYLSLFYNLITAKEKKACELQYNDIPLADRELMDLLEPEDLPTTGSSHVLALRCKNNNLPVTRSVQTGRIPHWEGTSKGLVNICVERGLVPLQKLLVDKQYYTKQGKKVNGEIDERTSLVFILGECADFKNEVSVLQKIADKYNAVVWFTPKYHCEIAGEGVEYAWGYGKRIYRRVPMKEKKKKQDFESLVKRIFSRETISSTVIRRFSGRARQYICSYHVLHNQQKQGDLKEKLSISLAEVEKVAKQFKTHRCALDFDFRFIEAEVENSGAGSKKLNQVKRDLLKFIPVSNMKLYPGSQFDRSGGNGKRK
jgi:hypothetical protein